jgi:hypothetical protein
MFWEIGACVSDFDESCAIVHDNRHLGICHYEDLLL